MTGFEPATFGLEVQRAIQLRHTGEKHATRAKKHGTRAKNMPHMLMIAYDQSLVTHCGT